tara:strand:+ start:392 stop:535 length:144 start_codon:yes stop_codon:yes gene_type:complete
MSTIDQAMTEIDKILNKSIYVPPMDDYDAGVLKGLRLAKEILDKEDD